MVVPSEEIARSQRRPIVRNPFYAEERVYANKQDEEAYLQRMQEIYNKARFEEVNARRAAAGLREKGEEHHVITGANRARAGSAGFLSARISDG